MWQADAQRLLRQIPGAVTAAWPEGERFVQALAHGSMSVELYAPTGVDPQQPHAQDELYFVNTGTSDFVLAAQRSSVGPGSVLFVPAGCEHRFEHFSADFSTWVVFWGSQGGEARSACTAGEDAL